MVQGQWGHVDEYTGRSRCHRTIGKVRIGQLVGTWVSTQKVVYMPKVERDRRTTEGAGGRAHNRGGQTQSSQCRDRDRDIGEVSVYLRGPTRTTMNLGRMKTRSS